MSERFGPYKLGDVLGRGGMGVVYRAYDTRRDRIVALKRLQSHLVGDGDFRERFRRESALVARLREPHVIPIHDYGEIDGELYIDMRLVEGHDLGQLIARGPMPAGRAVDILAQIAGALNAAHAEGLVHRDVKPSNILVVENGETGGSVPDFVYLVDFGIARALDGNNVSLTGNPVGTIAYMAPERFNDSPWDRRVDIYSLTCVLYECITGLKPYPAENLAMAVYMHSAAVPPRPSDHGVAVGFDRVIARGLAKSPDARYATAGALIEDARAALATDPSRSRGPAGSDGRARLSTSPPAESPPSRPHDAPGRRWSLRSARLRWLVGLLVVLQIVVAVVITQTGSTFSYVGIGPGPTSAAITADGSRLFVAAGNADSVSVVDTSRRVVLSTVPVRARPIDIAVTRDGGRLFVTNEGLDSVLSVDLGRETPAGTPIAVGGRPAALEVSPDGRHVVVTRQDESSVAVVDIASASAPLIIPVGGGPTGVAISPDSHTAFVANRDDNSVSVVDLMSGRVVGRPIAVGDRPVALAVTPDGGRVYVANQGSGTVSVIEVVSRTVVRPAVPVGDAPSGVAVSPDGQRVYIVNRGSDTISVLDTVLDETAGRPLATGRAPVDVVVSPGSTTVYAVDQDEGAVAVHER